MADNINTPAATVDTPPTATVVTPQAQASAKPEDIAAAFLAALDARTQRAERSVAKSFGEQYGMTDDEINQILADAKAKKAAEIPANVQAEIEKREKALNDRAITAELREKGAEMGLVDAETALQIIGRDSITVEADGTVRGVEEALKSLQETKPYFFTAKPTGNTAVVGAKITGSEGAVDGVEAAFLARNPNLKL